MAFPINCIRGIPNNRFLIDEGTVGAHLFYFDLGTERHDGWVEQSINWEDNDSVVEFTLAQTRTGGEVQFKGGAALIPRAEIDRLKNLPVTRGLLSYERQAKDDNPFHGNILLQAKTSKPTMRLIAAGLALAVCRVVLRDRD